MSHARRPFGAGDTAIMGRLDKLDLSRSLSRQEEQERLPNSQKRLLALRLQLGGKLGDGALGPPVCVVLEGWDASGKGGAIKRLVSPLDPRHVRVATFAAPTSDEKRHHFLWRFAPALPGWGGMAVLDRSWYGRVLVERIEGYATQEQWSRAYDEIVGYERMLAREGMVMIKFWLHISDDEQLKRFRRRERDPVKRWKLTEDDWRNRGRREDYIQAIEDMFEGTDHEHGPWELVEAELEAVRARQGGGDRDRARRARMRDHGMHPVEVKPESGAEVPDRAMRGVERRVRAFVQDTGFRTDAERFGWSFVFAGLLPDDFPPTRPAAQPMVAAGRGRRLAPSRGPAVGPRRAAAAIP